MRNFKTILLTLFVYLILCSASLFAAYYFGVLGLQERLLSQKKQEIMGVLNHVSDKTADSLLFHESGPDSLIKLFSNRFEGRFRVRRIEVLDDKGRMLATTQDELIASVMQSADASQLLKNGLSGFYFVEGEKLLQLHLLKSFSFKDRIIGGVETVFDISDIEGMVKRIAILVFIIIITLFLIGFLFHIYRVLKFRSVINEVKRSLALIENGQFGDNSSTEWNKEYTDLFEKLGHAMGSLKERQEKREILFERAKQIASCLIPGELFEKLSEAFKTDVGMDQLIIMLVKDDTLVVNHTSGYDEALVLKNEIYKTQEDVFTEIMDYGKPLLIEDEHEVRQNTRYRAVIKASGVIALFPITLGNEIFGIVHVSRAKEKGQYKAAEMDAGSLLAGGAAIGLSRITDGIDTRAVAKEIAKPEVREIKGPGSIDIRAVSLTGNGWVEFFELTGDKKEDIQIICIHGSNPDVRNQVRDRVIGMLDIIRKFKTTLGNLSYFALSMLLKMPVSTEREQIVKQFMENPFTPEGLYLLFNTLLNSKELKIKIEIVKIDLKKKSYLAQLNLLRPYLIPDGIQASLSESKGPFEREDYLVVAPENLLSVRDFENIKNEKVPDKLIALLQPKFEALKARAEEDALPCPAVVIISQL